MNEAVIAVVFDFDGTLGQDTIHSLLSSSSVAPKTFWTQVNEMVHDGWDPPLAYMHLLWEHEQAGKLDLSQRALGKLGKQLELYPGLPKAFSELREYVRTEPELKEARITLEYFIISGGIEAMIVGSNLGKEIDGIFGSNFAYDAKGEKVIGIKSAISFTEKTRFLYGINKGIGVRELRANPYKINDALPQGTRRIPFVQMIYIGDGPSDIPCLSAITQYGGTGIGVSSPTTTFKKGYELARGKRITVGPYTANYQKGSDMRKVLEATILRIGLEIGINQKKHIINAPEMG